MQILPIHTPRIEVGTNLAQLLASVSPLEKNDVLVLSSKAVARSEGTGVDVSSLTISREAKEWATRSGQSPAFAQAILDETRRLNGTIVGACPSALLTVLRPTGIMRGVLLVPNAGMDQSNIEEGFSIGWPWDPVKSIRNLREKLQNHVEQQDYGFRVTSTDNPATRNPQPATIAVILSDSCVRPGRQGVTAFSLTVSGIDPIQSQIGKADLFGHPLRVTQEAIADQLATAANAVMGNADQSIPAAIIRDHGFAFSDYEGWVPGIEPEEDLFKGYTVHR